MAHFKLVPIDRLLRSIEYDAINVASVLEVTMREALGETDVYCNGKYKFTISHGNSGVWAITQRKTAFGYFAKLDSRTIKFPVDLQGPFCPQPEAA